MLNRLLIVIVSIISSVSHCLGHTDRMHKTPRAQERINDLVCYACDTMVHGANCTTNPPANYSTMTQKCNESEVFCMVQRFSYTISTEYNATGIKMWSLQRMCAQKCDASCIVIGERVKLYACTSCCNTSFCNVGNGAATLPRWTFGLGPGFPLFLTLFRLF